MASHPLHLRTILSVAWKIALLIGFLIAAKHMGDWVAGQLSPYLTPGTEPMLHRLIITALGIYILLLMLPFVPGVEIGIGMMMAFGPDIAPLVYGGTVVALTLSFAIGRLVPQEVIIKVFAALRLRRAAGLLQELEPLGPEQRLQFIVRNASLRLVPFLLRYRLVALMLALNLPGNAVIGGGGGICMTAGFCRLFPLPGFLIAVALAVAPVPLMVYFAG